MKTVTSKTTKAQLIEMLQETADSSAKLQELQERQTFLIILSGVLTVWALFF